MRFVLVHGAFVGGWIWGPLAERLEELGHTTEAPDLPGAGDDRTPVEEVTLGAYADRICDLLDADERSILVANSMGGMVISEAAARRPDRVKRSSTWRLSCRRRPEPGRPDEPARGPTTSCSRPSSSRATPGRDPAVVDLSSVERGLLAR
jgi:hypothetical protein